jgi:hypothetical protein
VLLITCPFFYPLHEEPADYWRPTGYALRLCAAAAGLTLLTERRAGDPWDVLATLLGHTGLVAATRQLPDRVLARGARALKSAAFGLLLRRVLQPRLRLTGDIYLSNIMVFQRPST